SELCRQFGGGRGPMSAAPQPAPPSRHDTPFFRQPAAEVVRALGSDARRGLTSAEAQRRLRQYGPNELTTEKPVPGWKKFLREFKDPLVLLLLAATVISAVLWLHERDTA